ncbi:hypothetical protein [Nostoc flagelliforme]|uniref:hypothetical protein n=1 Tax=Nostoc flagelliforme TaxID=1306274 RepID=UPI0012FDB85F
MSSIEKLASSAQQQNFDERSVNIYNNVYEDAGVRSIKNMSIRHFQKIKCPAVSII